MDRQNYKPRIARLRMRPMSLYESGEADLRKLIELIVRGGNSKGNTA